MSEFEGSGPNGLILPEDLTMPFDDEAEEMGRLGISAEEMDEEAQTPVSKYDVKRFEQLVDRLMRAMKFWLDLSDAERNARFDGLQTFILRSVGVAGREQVAAAWSGPAEGMLRLGRAVAQFGDLKEGEEFDEHHAARIVEELDHACAELERATSKEEGKVSPLDEALGTDGTLGQRVEAVKERVSGVRNALGCLIEGDDGPYERAVVGVLGQQVMVLARLFGARGDGKALALKPVAIGGDRGGPREPRETREVRAFRADFELAMKGIRSRLRWQEWTVRVLVLAVGLGVGWSLGLGGVSLGILG